METHVHGEREAISIWKINKLSREICWGNKKPFLPSIVTSLTWIFKGGENFIFTHFFSIKIISTNFCYS